MSSNIISLHNTFNAQSNVYDLSLVQFVGLWDYDKMEFIVSNSSWITFKEATSLDNIFSTENIKRANKNKMFNQNYQNTQKYFNLGLDFIVTSKNFKNLKIPNDYLSKRFYTRYFKLLD